MSFFGRTRRSWATQFLLGILAVLPLTAEADSQFWITGPVNGSVIDADNYSVTLPVYWDIDHPDYSSERVLDFKLFVDDTNHLLNYSTLGQEAHVEFEHLGCAPVIRLWIRFWYLSGIYIRYGELYSNPIQLYVVDGAAGPCLPEPESCEQEVGGPIDVATGRMRYDTVDLQLGGAFPLGLARRYRSDRTDDGPIGVGWSHSYMTRLEVAGNTVKLHDAAGRVVSFGKANGVYYPNRHARLSLAAITGGYRVTDPVIASTYDFDSAGNLTSITNRDGLTHTLTYSSGLLQTVADLHGRSLVFAYDGNDRLDTVTANPSGIVIDYTVNDVDAKLESVLDPLDHAETYFYTDPSDPHNLTAVHDALGRIVEEHIYDENDRVTDFRRALDADKIHIDYLSATQTDVTQYISLSPLETVTSTYTFDAVWKVVTALNGPACECAGESESRSFTWDTWLNKLTETDGLGRVTKYE